MDSEEDLATERITESSLRTRWWCWIGHRVALRSSAWRDVGCGHQLGFLKREKLFSLTVGSRLCWWWGHRDDRRINTCESETWLVEVSGCNHCFGARGTSSGRSGWDRFGHAGYIVDRTIIVPTGYATRLGHLDRNERRDVGLYQDRMENFSQIIKQTQNT